MTEEIKLSDLQPDHRNANKGSERGKYMLDRSVEKLGLGRSILIDKNNKIIAGNKTTETAADLGMDDGVIIVDSDGTKLIAVRRNDLDLDDDTGLARELAYADNRTGQVSLEFDPDVIAADLEMGVDLGDWFQDFELEEIGALTDEPLEEGDAEPQISRADELQEEWGVELGQMWRLPSRTEGQEHRLICGDCTDVAVVDRVMGGEVAELLSLDVPYGLGLHNDKQTIGKSREYGAVIGDENTDVAVKIYNALRGMCKNEVWWGANHWGGLLLDNSACWLVWDKDHHGMTFADAEIAWTSLRMPIRVFRHAWSGNHRASENGDERYHINQKPIALYMWYLEFASTIGGCVFDGCLGSASQLIAAENLSRQCRAVEISPAYVAVALQRYKDAFGIEPELMS